MTVKVRIAPSPTGDMHVGTAQSALFNWLFARHNGGQFYFRIEDTDRERSKKEYETGIIEGLRWLGLDWDNSEIYRQSEHTNTYRKRIKQLLDNGKAVWRQYSPEEKAAMEQEGRPARDKVIVLAYDGDPERTITWDDVIRGPVTVVAKNVGQLVIAKSLDEPLYHFAVVVDDIDMGITHVIRGEDHISNTPKQILIYEALGAPLPRFAHLPLLFAPDRSKLSKRNGAVSVNDFRKDYLPEALINFLGSLSYTFDPEFLNREDMIRAFDLQRVHKSGAVFDVNKLNWFNAQYIRRLEPQSFKTLIGKPDLPDAAVAIMTERLERLSDVASFSYLWEIPDYDAQLLNWKDNPTEQTREALAVCLEFAENDALSEKDLDALALKKYGGKKGSVYWPLRVALSGARNSAGPLEIAAAIGGTAVINRLKSAISKLET